MGIKKIGKKLPLKLESQFSNAYVIIDCEQIQKTYLKKSLL